MVAQPDGVADVVFPIGHEIMCFIVGTNRSVHVGALGAGFDRGKGRVLKGNHVVKHTLLLVAGGTDDHRSL